MFGHFLGLFLAHRAAQQIGAAEAVAADDLRHLHHLLLVDHDGVGLGEDAFDTRIGITEAFAVFSRTEFRDQLHRPRSIQRDQRDNVAKAVWLGAFQHVAHAARFKLEHRGGLRSRKNPIRFDIVERYRFQHHRRRRVETLDVAQCPVEYGQRRQAKEVELHQPHRFDVFHVELRHHAGRAFRRVERAEIRQLARRDQHAARVHADVARHALETPRQFEQFAHFFFLRFALVDQRLDFARVNRLIVFRIGAPAQRDMPPGLERDELGDLVAEVVTQVEHAPDVAYHRFRGHGAEGDDLRHTVGAVFMPHVFDHAVAAVLAEIDIEVGHRHALGIEKALEQQVVAQRIEIGDAQRVSNQRTSARAAPGPDRHAVRLRPVDEIGDDQEVAGETHLQNGLDFEFEPLLIDRQLLSAQRGIRIKLFETAHQAFLRAVAQIVVETFLVRRGESRQFRFAEFKRQVAAFGDFDTVGERLRNVGEQFRHFGLRLEILIGAEMPRAALVGEHVAFSDADARLVRAEIVGVDELHGMRRHHRQLQLGSDLQRLLHAAFDLPHRLRPLQLEIVTLRKNI